MTGRRPHEQCFPKVKRMTNSNNEDEVSEEQEVFVDASEEGPGAGASPDLPPLRRSTRKRKSESESTATAAAYKGKRHRPLGNQEKDKDINMERTPDTNKKTTSRTQNKTPGTSTAKTSTETNQRGKQAEEDQIPRGPEMMMFMGGIRSMLREELQKTEDALTNRLGGLEDRIGRLEDRADDIDSRIDERVEEMVASRLASRPRSDVSGDGSVNFAEMPSARDKRYWKARRSLRMWPIVGDGSQMKNAVLTFLTGKLRLGEDVIADAEESHIARVPAGPIKGKIRHEVVVEFPSVDLRDLVRKSAFNLAGDPGSGIRLEVPHHLMKNFKALESASYKLKQKFSNIKRNIKFDDERCDLCLEFKLSEGHAWKRIRPDQAKEMQRSDGEAEELSASEVTSLLSGREEQEDETV